MRPDQCLRLPPTADLDQLVAAGRMHPDTATEIKRYRAYLRDMAERRKAGATRDEAWTAAYPVHYPDMPQLADMTRQASDDLARPARAEAKVTISRQEYDHPDDCPCEHCGRNRPARTRTIATAYQVGRRPSDNVAKQEDLQQEGEDLQ